MRLQKLHLLLLTSLIPLLMGAGQDTSVSLSDVTGLLREFGFPVFVSIWFMWRLERRMDASTDSTNKLLTIVTILSKSMDGLLAERVRARGNLERSGQAEEKDVA